MTTAFTFRDECMKYYDLETYDLVMELFDNLPLVAIVNGLYMCVHGGISPDLMDI
jgi:serine/threonine-protein phosphatase 2B catalytic subunit